MTLRESHIVSIKKREEFKILSHQITSFRLDLDKFAQTRGVMSVGFQWDDKNINVFWKTHLDEKINKLKSCANKLVSKYFGIGSCGLEIKFSIKNYHS